MNNFPYAIEMPLKSEGGYANDPKDPGGETYRGISRLAYPDWTGWAKLDAIADKKYNQVFPALENEVQLFYYNEKWLKNNLDKIDDKDVAAAALDTVIQHGKGATLIQRALQNIGRPVSVDGKIGPDTVSALNKSTPKTFLSALHDVREAYYQTLVDKDPSLAKFLPGWLARISPWKGAAMAGGSLAALAALVGGAWYYLKKKKIV
jgi:lysozyme family protein